jgi:hypothetical protein
MPIFEMPVKYPPYVFWNSAIGAKHIAEAEQNEAITEFNTQLTSARESLGMWFWESHFSKSDWAFGGVLSVDTDGAIDTTQSPEDLLMNLADRLDAFLAGRFHITGRSSTRSFGEMTERARRSGEPVIVDVTVDEFLGKEVANTLAAEAFIQEKLSKGHVRYRRDEIGGPDETPLPPA